MKVIGQVEIAQEAFMSVLRLGEEGDVAKLRRRRVRLTYPPALLNQPILYRLITQFDVMVNVVEARVNADKGWFVLDVEGSAAAVVQALRWLAEQGLQVEDMPSA